MFHDDKEPGSGTPPRGHRLRPSKLRDLLPEWRRAAETAYQARLHGRPLGPVTGIYRLDRELGGRLQPGIHIIHGQPGAGKTALALQVAVSCGCPALFVSCEMGLLELFRRVAASEAEEPLGRLKSGEFTPDTSMHVAQRAAQAFPHLSLVDATRGQASSAKLLETARSVRAESEHFLIVLDSVHAWADGLNADLSEYDRINRTLTDLRLLASELDCPILAVAERNRSSMGTGGLSAGAGSRKIEYGAETVFDLTRDDGQVGVTGELPVSVTLAKNRNGSPGAKVSLLFNGGLQRFREA